MLIKQLNCRVVVRGSGNKESPVASGESSPRPNMLFALPNAPVSMETAPLPSRTAEGQQDQAEGRNQAPMARARRADPKAVADRVYQLLKDEIRLQRLRGG